MIDFIDFTAEPSGQFKYIFLTQDIFSRKLWSKALEDKDMSSAIQQLRILFADEENQPKSMQMASLITKPSIDFCPSKI